ncbi:MAG: hypothetical protein ACR2M0_15075 [Chloroflexia bacterium]
MGLARFAGVLLLALALTACTTDATPTPVPATPTPQPATPQPTSAPTSAPAPPTELPQTAVPPTVPPPTTAPPTEVLPTAASTTVPPTEVPTTAALPTPAPPTRTAVPAAPSAVPPSRTAAVPAAPTTRPPNISPTPNPQSALHSPQLIASGEGNPDDLTVATDGTIYFGDFANSAINRILPGGKPVPVATGLRDPEGIVVAPDGRLIVEEQKTNSILEIDPASGAKLLIRQLTNTTGQDGVDGLALDPATGDILVPDSPNGRLLTLSRDGSQLRTIATGFTRPTGVAVLPDGEMLVADEFGNALYRVTRAGRKTVVATMFQPDDVVLARTGIAYVNSLGGAIYRVDPNTGARTTLLTGLKLPHGLGIDPQGRLVGAEAGRNRIFWIGP